MDGAAEAPRVEEKKRAATQRCTAMNIHQMVALPESLFIFQYIQNIFPVFRLPAPYVIFSHIRCKIRQTAAPAAKTLFLPVMPVVIFHFESRSRRSTRSSLA